MWEAWLRRWEIEKDRRNTGWNERQTRTGCRKVIVECLEYSCAFSLRLSSPFDDAYIMWNSTLLVCSTRYYAGYVIVPWLWYGNCKRIAVTRWTFLVFSLRIHRWNRWRENNSWQPWRVLKTWRMIGTRYVRSALTAGRALVSLYFLFKFPRIMGVWNIFKINCKNLVSKRVFTSL